MKILIHLFAFFFLVNTSGYSQEKLLEKTIGYQNDDIFFETIELNDGGYLSLGWTFSLGNGATDFYLIKSNPFGDKLWEKTYGGFDLETGISVKELANGNILLSGTTRSFGSGLGDCIFIITDSAGNKLNEFYYGGFGDDYLRESIISMDNKIVFTGYSNSFGNGMKDIILGKIDLNGKLEWIRNFGGSRDDEGWHVAPTQDGGYIVSGFTSIASTTVHSKNIKADHYGKVVWEFDRLQKRIEYGINTTLEDQSGEFVSAHTVQNSNSGKSQIELYRLSKSGQFISSKIYESNLNAELRSMVKSNCGYAISFSSWDQRNKSDISIMLTDQNLNEVKKLYISKPGKDDAWKTTYKNNKIIISGSTTNEINNNLDGIFAVIDMGDCKQKNIECIKLKIEDCAIGYHDFYNTSSTNYNDAIQFAAYTIPGASGGYNKNRGLMNFEIPGFLDSVTNLSVRLSLFGTGPLGALEGHTGNSNKGVLQRIIEPWNIDAVTWDNQPHTTTINQILLPQPSSPDQNYLNLDITNLFLDLGKSSYGIMLKQFEESSPNALVFASIDYPNPALHPTLEVCYTNPKTSLNSDCPTIIIKPNPVFEFLILETNSNSLSENYYLRLFSINGMLISEFKITEATTTVDVSNYAQGMYLAQIKSSNCINNYKFEVLKN